MYLFFYFSLFIDQGIIAVSKKDIKQNVSSHKNEPNNDKSVDTNKELERCQKESEQLKAQFIRATADLENFKRRMEKEQAQWYQAAQAALLIDLLNVVDNFDHALQEKKKEERSAEFQAWLEGFELIRKSFDTLLQKYEVKEIKEVVEFDPQFHEAVAQVDAPDKKSGQIVEVVQKGYTFKGELLRPAKVTVAR